MSPRFEDALMDFDLHKLRGNRRSKKSRFSRSLSTAAKSKASASCPRSPASSDMQNINDARECCKCDCHKCPCCGCCQCCCQCHCGSSSMSPRQLPAKCPVKLFQKLEKRDSSILNSEKIGKIEFQEQPKSRKAARKMAREEQTWGISCSTSAPSSPAKNSQTGCFILPNSTGMTKRQRKAAQALTKSVISAKTSKPATPSPKSKNPSQSSEKLAKQPRRPMNFSCKQQGRNNSRLQHALNLDIQDSLAASCELGQSVFYRYFSVLDLPASHNHFEEEWDPASDWKQDLEVFLQSPPEILPDLSETLAPQKFPTGDLLSPRLPTFSRGENLVLGTVREEDEDEDEFDAHFENFANFEEHFGDSKTTTSSEELNEHMTAEEEHEMFWGEKKQEVEEEPEFFFVDLFADEEDDEDIVFVEKTEPDESEDEDGFFVLDLED